MMTRPISTRFWCHALAACALVLLAVASQNAAYAAKVQWYVEILDPKPDRPQGLEARVFTKDGFRVRLYRRDDASIWGEFVLPRLFQVGFDEASLPTLRVDGNLPHDLNALTRLEAGFERRLSRVVDKRVNFLIWKSATAGFIPPLLREMMKGKTMTVTYTTEDSRRQTVNVPLTRANRAIARFLDVTPLAKTTADDASALASFDSIAAQHISLCDELRFSGDDGDYARCRRVFERCSEKPGQSTADFQACLTAP